MSVQTREVIVIPATIGNHIDSTIQKKLRVASYSRVSTDFDEQISSFDNQKAYYTDLILKNPMWTPSGSYADEGISGANAENRPDFMRMIRHCKKGKIDLIITKSVSRFARNTLDAVKYVRLLKSLGVGVLFEKEGINTLEESSELFLTIMSSLAQEELNSLSQNVKMGKRMLMKEGKVTYHYSGMYGYKKGKNGLPEIISEEAEVIQRMFQRYLVGDSVRKIAITLNSENLSDRKGKQWNDNKIRSILEHERYCGDVILQKTYIENPISKKVKVNNGELPKYHIKNNHDAIVTRETWSAVQAELLRRSNKVKNLHEKVSSRGKYNGKYALSEKLICGCCGSFYQRVVWTKRDKSKQPVWRCSRQVATKDCEMSPNIDESALHDGIVNALFSDFTTSTPNDSPLLLKIRATYESDIDPEFNIAQAEEKIERLKVKAIEMVVQCSENNSLHANQEQIKALSDEAKNLQKQVERAKEQRKNQEYQEKLDEKMIAITHHLSAYTQGYPREYDDSLVRQAIKAIKVVDSHEIEIHFSNGTIKTETIVAKIKKLMVG